MTYGIRRGQERGRLMGQGGVSWRGKGGTCRGRTGLAVQLEGHAGHTGVAAGAGRRGWRSNHHLLLAARGHYFRPIPIRMLSNCHMLAMHHMT
jgi:hypothetical protein